MLIYSIWFSYIILSTLFVTLFFVFRFSFFIVLSLLINKYGIFFLFRFKLEVTSFIIILGFVYFIRFDKIRFVFSIVILLFFHRNTIPVG